MSIWIRVVVRSSLADVTPEALREGVVERLPRLAATYGEDGAAVANEHLRVVRRPKEGAGAEFDVFELRWAPDQERPLRIERWVDGKAEEELRELSAWLASYLENEDDEGADEIAETLDAAEETIGLELGPNQTEGIGWPVAMAAAAYLAERGDGLLRADGEGWLAPEEGELRHLLEAD